MNRAICLLLLAGCLVVGIGDSVLAQVPAMLSVSGPVNAADPNSYVYIAFTPPPAGTIYVARCQEVVMNNPMMPNFNPAFGAFRPAPGAGIITGALAAGNMAGMPVHMATVSVPKGPGKLYAVEVYSNTAGVLSYFFPGPATAVSKFGNMNPCLALPVP